MPQRVKSGTHVIRWNIRILLCLRWSVILLLLSAFSVHAQNNVSPNTLVTIDVENLSFMEVLNLIEKQIPYKFAYRSELIANQKNISIHIQQIPLQELLDLLFKKTNIRYEIMDNQIILQERSNVKQVTFSGYVRDSLSGEFLPGAVVYFPEQKTGTYTNNYGFFSITQNQMDSMEIWFSYIGYHKISLKENAQKSFTKNFFLSENNIQFKTVEISKDHLDDNVKKNGLGRTDVSLEMIKTVPSINGNGDVIHTIEMMPGVIAGLDGRSGYFIRGGNTDQNLVQLDEATIFNPNHLLGLISIFNTSAVKSVTLLKGGFPASFGDHLSSVLDVTMMDGNFEQLGGNIQIGTISSGLSLSGPLPGNNASFLVSARRSTIDYLLKPFNLSNYYSNYYFYDVNAKLNVRISPTDRIYLSLYQGKDNSAYSKDSSKLNAISYGVHYGNQAITLRWTHLFSQKIFTNTSVIYNNYFHFTTAQQKLYYAELYSGIRDLEIKTDVNYYPNVNHRISTGINYLHQTLFPASIAVKTIATDPNPSIDPSVIPQKYANRFSIYFSDEIRFSAKFSAYLGARMPIFNNGNNQYINFEPRFALLHLINPTTSIKFSYTEMHQYLHLVQSYNASFPAEIWIGSSKIVKPQNCQQASIGLFKNFKANSFQTSLEVYYKHFGNQLLFKGALNPSITNDMESTLIFGQGQSYGTELFVKKTTGKFTGWLAYTFSFAYQQFDSLNLGQKFPFANDRRHSLYLSASYAISQHWELSSNFLLTSGRAFTLFKYTSSNPSWQYGNPLYYNTKTNSNSGKGSGKIGSEDAGSTSSNQVEQNNYRLAPYNRLDISVSYKKSRVLTHRVIETELVFSVYNVYARANTYFAYCSINPKTSQPIAVEVSFVPIIPSISYNLKF